MTISPTPAVVGGRRASRLLVAVFVGLCLLPVSFAAAHTARRSSSLAGQVAPVAPEAVSAYETTPNLSEALTPQPTLEFLPGTGASRHPVVSVDDTRRYQRFLGAGAAMTDASAWLVWDDLSPSVRSETLNALFGKSGIHLSFVRVPMGASDYTVNGTPYTYDDQPASESDPGLADFSIAHDEAYILPALREAKALNPSLYVEALPWSPPAWMKSNDALDNTAHAGALLPAAYGWLAEYFVKFLQGYRAAGVPVNAIAPQNEPGVPAFYPSLQLNQQEEATFVSLYLLPALKLAGLSPSVFGWDLSWGRLGSATPLVRSTFGGLTGLAWHCYFGLPGVMSVAHYENPRMEQLVDECSPSQGQFEATSAMMIASLRNWANAVATWNLALDPSGAPKQPPGTSCIDCTGLVTVNEQTGTATPTVDYFELGQLTRFVATGAVRIATPHFVSYQLNSGRHLVSSPGLDDVAFLNPNGSKVLVLYNSATRPITFQVRWRGKHLSDSVPAGTTLTLVWR